MWLCIAMDNPPKEIKKHAKIALDIRDTPVVISTNPARNGGNPKTLAII
jgi:hypothetical protein